LADIINRIASDASAESEGELAAASARADELLGAAAATAQAHHERAIEAAARDSASQAATIVSSARLAARDRALSAKRELVTSTLSRVVEAIESLPADAYVRFLAAGVAGSVRAGDSVALAAADSEHMAALQAIVTAEAPDVPLLWDAAPARVSRGVVVTGPRTSVEVTPSSVVDERRDDLELAVATRLFSGKER
jgi:vacuolar-type H+-ATPase subunit E/Vma4